MYYDNSCIKRDSCRKIRKIACIKILNYMGDSAFVHCILSQICLHFLQPVAPDFDVKAKVTEILEKGDFEKKRARTMDIDDFLG